MKLEPFTREYLRPVFQKRTWLLRVVGIISLPLLPVLIPLAVVLNNYKGMWESTREICLEVIRAIFAEVKPLRGDE